MKRIENIVIVGGGTSGWMTAAALAKALQGQVNVSLVESDEIGTIGVGEATIPIISLFNRMLELDENEFIRATQATFKLGIEFLNWGQIGDRYIHGFGGVGPPGNWTVDFHHYWLKQHLAGKGGDIHGFSLNTAACASNRFMRPSGAPPNSPLSQIAYAFHFDASLYAKFLRKYSEARKVKRIEGKVIDANLDGESGNVDSIQLADGNQIAADLFIDCSGFRGLLIEEALKTGYEDWSHWLPCDRAMAVPCESVDPLTPYTRATADSAGWRWRIPLQHRTGNGHVYCSSFISDEDATESLLRNLDGKALAEPRPIRFVTGRRRLAWNKNVVSIGLAGGFVEPLESTSIHLVQMGIQHLLTNFPSASIDSADRDQYNNAMHAEYEWVRDFIILHYKATERDDTPFWRHCRDMKIPDTLQHRIDLFRSHGRVFREGSELFMKPSWLQVMLGQRIVPRSYHPLVDLLSEKEMDAYLANVEQLIAKCVQTMPTHSQYIAKHCKAAKP